MTLFKLLDKNRQQMIFFFCYVWKWKSLLAHINMCLDYWFSSIQCGYLTASDAILEIALRLSEGVLFVCFRTATFLNKAS